MGDIFSHMKDHLFKRQSHGQASVSVPHVAGTIYSVWRDIKNSRQPPLDVNQVSLPASSPPHPRGRSARPVMGQVANESSPEDLLLQLTAVLP